MALTKFTGAVNNIQSLSDRPNEIDGLTSAELKEKFDKTGADLKTYINEILTEEIESLVSTQFSNIYPVGSIYMSVNPTNPSTLFGGTWTSWGTGRVPVGIDTSQTEFETVEKMGGSKFMQRHTHTAPKGLRLVVPSGNAYAVQDFVKLSDSNVTTSEAGTGDSGNLQPYITCYMWKRIS